MAKRLTEKQIKEISLSFTKGKTIKILSEKYNVSKLTIIRNIKKNLGELRYLELLNEEVSSKRNNKDKINNKKLKNLEENLDNSDIDFNEAKSPQESPVEERFYNEPSFVEITPLDYEIENSPRKELSSVPISDVDFPNIVYMIVDLQIELEIKTLKDYPEWQFLPSEDLNRKTIEIFFDLKIAKSLCNKGQKVIKVQNSDVFRIAAPILVSRGISRIVSNDKLIAL